MILEEIYKSAKLANEEIASFLSKSTQSHYQYLSKGFGGDLSSESDIVCEQILCKHLLRFSDVFSEESGYIESNQISKIKNSKFVIDPLDGSDNYLSNLPYYGSSISFEIDGETKFSMIYNYVHNSFVAKLESDLIISKTFSNRKIAIFERAYSSPKMCQRLFENNIKYRSPGAVALSLANARFLQFLLFAGSIREFDIKAGLHINSDLKIFQNNSFLLVCENEAIFDQIKNLILELH